VGKALIAQRRSNKFGHFLVVEVYGGGGRRGSFVVPEGREGEGWRIFTAELSKAVAFFDFALSSPVVEGRPLAWVTLHWLLCARSLC
jgi:hypothetical protein